MTKTKEKKQPKVYNFNEKEEEYYAKLGKTLPVWQSPKYKQSVTKAIELIEKGDYGLDEGDFWILTISMQFILIQILNIGMILVFKETRYFI